MEVARRNHSNAFCFSDKPCNSPRFIRQISGDEQSLDSRFAGSIVPLRDTWKWGMGSFSAETVQGLQGKADPGFPEAHSYALENLKLRRKCKAAA